MYDARYEKGRATVHDTWAKKEANGRGNNQVILR